MVAAMAKINAAQTVQRSLFSEIKTLIDQSRQNTAMAVNAEITALYWHIGHRIKNGVLSGERAEYGERTIEYLSERLTSEYGRGWSAKQLRHCVRLAEVFPDEQIVSAVRRQLPWTSIKALIYIDEPLKREFYLEICKVEGWSSRTLNERIQSMLFERTAISKKPDKTIKQELQNIREEKKPAPDLIFRDPYFLDFLGLRDSYSEKDFESAIAAYKGQMELYLRWLEKHETREGENLPIGLILCSGKNEEHVELMQLDKSNIRVAEYLTKLPEMKLLAEKLKLSVELARQKLERNAAEGSKE
jgi:hypothetical protein